MNKSFVDCSKCMYNENEQIVCLTNCQKDLRKVEVLYVSDYPIGKDIEEIAKDKNENYLITSMILCETDSPPSDDVMGYCKDNCKKFFEMAKPHRVITIGENSKEEFPNSDNYTDLNAFIDSAAKPPNIEDDIVLDLSAFEHTTENKGEPVEVSDSDELYMFKIKEEFYGEDYRLVDIQYMSGKDQLVFIFRDKDNKKIFYEPERKHNNYYWYESTGQKIIENIDNLQLMIGNYKDRNLGPNCYESDIKIDVKHAVDYYLQSKGEPSLTNKNVLYFDIEVYTYKNQAFPVPDKAEYPINAISFCLDDAEIETYILWLEGETDPNLEEVRKKYPKVTVFTSEKVMLKTFLQKINTYQPDIIAGWNIRGFDIPYVITRMKKLGIPSSVFSPYSNIYADYKTARCIVTGYVILDQLWLYKELTYTNEPSYTLDAIAQKVVGESKEKYDGNLNTIYNDNIEKFIQYSIQDASLLRKIEDEVNHITLQDELRKASTTNFAGSMSTIGQADGLFMTSMKEKGLSPRNAGHPVKEELPGAYVFNPRGGLYPSVGQKGLLCDFDFTSLYPSIINSWNVGPNTFFGKIDDDIMFKYLYDKDKLKGTEFTFYEDPIHTTKQRQITVDELDKIVEENNALLNISGCIYVGHNKEESIYYSIISSLFSNRKKNKNIMFEYKQKGDKTNTRIYDGKQQSFKILMNSLYGVLANEHFRFYSNDLARSITLSGQELLKFSAVHCDRYMRGVDGIDINFMETVEQPLDYVIYGDTDSIFVDLTEYLKKKNLQPEASEEVDEAVREIQTYLNETIMNGVCDRHRIPKDISMLELKNEYLFSKYYALNVKKKYATKVIAQEGRKLEFIDIKGLEIKRSDYSQVTQELLKHILESILSDDFSISKVNDYIREMELKVAELAENGDPSIAKSVAFSKPLKEYKTISQHIKGMLMWNEIVNEDFRHGSRGYLFPLKAIDLNKAPDNVKKNYNEKFLKKFKMSDLNVIVMPQDLDKLPSYFIPNVKQMVAFSVSDRTDLLLEPLVKKTQDLLLW